MSLASSLSDLLGLDSPPIAIAFVDEPPSGVNRVDKGEPAGCGYWRRASDGEVFYTVADDHKACPIGAHTHHVPLSAEERAELRDLVKTMVGLSYIGMEEVPHDMRRWLTRCPDRSRPCDAGGTRRRSISAVPGWLIPPGWTR